MMLYNSAVDGVRLQAIALPCVDVPNPALFLPSASSRLSAVIEVIHPSASAHSDPLAASRSKGFRG